MDVGVGVSVSVGVGVGVSVGVGVRCLVGALWPSLLHSRAPHASLLGRAACPSRPSAARLPGAPHSHQLTSRARMSPIEAFGVAGNEPLPPQSGASPLHPRHSCNLSCTAGYPRSSSPLPSPLSPCSSLPPPPSPVLLHPPALYVYVAASLLLDCFMPLGCAALGHMRLQPSMVRVWGRGGRGLGGRAGGPGGVGV